MIDHPPIATLAENSTVTTLPEPAGMDASANVGMRARAKSAAEEAPSPAHRVGEFSVQRVTERTIDSFTPDLLFPGSAPGLLAQHAEWLGPGCADASTNQLRLSIHTWVLRGGGQTILIDTCIGNFKQRPGKIFFHQLDTAYLDRLAAAGVKPDDVDLVLNTHLHTDHVGWNTRWVDGRWVPTFPRARYLFPQHELELVRAHDGHLRQVYEDSVKPVIDSGQAVTVPREGAVVGDLVGDLVGASTSRSSDASSEAWVANCLRFVPTPGHTAGHMSIWLESGDQRALFAGDVMHHPLQVREPQLSSVFCDAPAQATQTRHALLAELAACNARYFSSHFPASSVGRIAREGAGFAWCFD